VQEEGLDRRPQAADAFGRFEQAFLPSPVSTTIAAPCLRSIWPSVSSIFSTVVIPIAKFKKSPQRLIFYERVIAALVFPLNKGVNSTLPSN
jgi:hypothetical protein